MLPVLVATLVGLYLVAGSSASSCRFAKNYQCSDFNDPAKVDEYLDLVVTWEGQFAQPGVAYDPASGYSYDGHPLDYKTGELYGEPHLFSAPSKESIHVGLLALAVSGNEKALKFAGGFDAALKVLELKINGYEQFNATYPGFGCFTPWVGFNANGTFSPLSDWSNKVPGLDNGEWFWAIYAVASALESVKPQTAQVASLATRYRSYVKCQRDNAKTIFYRGEGQTSAVVTIIDAFAAPTPENYKEESGYLNDPYEGETMTQLLYLFADWESEEERNDLWIQKRGLFQKVDYIVPPEGGIYAGSKITVQEGFWFSTHEQWKALLMPYFSNDLSLVRRVFHSAEVVRTFDAYASNSPGLLASINDVTDGSEDIPTYISAAGIPGIGFQGIERRDVITPYGSFGLMMQNLSMGLCWYNNMLQGPRMQSRFGSTEAINVNGTEISPITTWDSKITTVLAMLGGVGDIVEKALKKEADVAARQVTLSKELPEKGHFRNSYDRFVYIVKREHELLFGNKDLPGEHVPMQAPRTPVPQDQLSDWDLTC